jgi:tetratricopeptide (TPR) repeat protein
MATRFMANFTEIQALFNHALAAIQAKRHEEARHMLIQVVRQAPRYEQAWLALASVMEDMAKAIDCLDRVLVINPNNTTAREWREFAVQEQARQVAPDNLQTSPPAAEVTIFEPGDEERPVPRLGQYLLDYKFITEAQLRFALTTQRQATHAGLTKRLGDVLVEQGALTEERLNFAVREQQRSFYSLFNE